MRGIIQRVKSSSVKVDGKITGEINKGIMILFGVGKEDSDKDLDYLVDKTVNLRIFNDDDGKMNLSVKDIKGEILIIPQFTLYGDVRKGRRPSFTDSASPEIGKEYFEKFIDRLKNEGLKVESGIFGADMDVELINNGPVTIILDSRREF